MSTKLIDAKDCCISIDGFAAEFPFWLDPVTKSLISLRLERSKLNLFFGDKYEGFVHVSSQP